MRSAATHVDHERDHERAAAAEREAHLVNQISYYRRVLQHVIHQLQVNETQATAERHDAILVASTNTFRGLPFDAVMHADLVKGDNEYGMPHFARPVDLDSYESGQPTGMVQREKDIILRTYLRHKSRGDGLEEKVCRVGELKGVRLVPRLLYVDGSGVAARDYNGSELGCEGMVLTGGVPKELDEHGHAVWCIQVHVSSNSVPPRHRWLGEGVLVIRIEPEEASVRKEWPCLFTDTVRFVVSKRPQELKRKR